MMEVTILQRQPRVFLSSSAVAAHSAVSPFPRSLVRLHTHRRVTDPDGPRQRKKRNRWGDAAENKAAGLMGLPTAIYSAMTTEQLDAYTLHLRIEEITQKLKINDVVPADDDRYVCTPCTPTAVLIAPRSPSPPPQYDNFGRRVNTREFRYRKRLEDERHKLVEKAMKTLPNYHPPADYRRPTKTQEKVYVPVNDYPEINFSMELTPLTSLFGFPSSLAFVLTACSGCSVLMRVWRHLQFSYVTNPNRPC